jgi:hypothetical protein
MLFQLHTDLSVDSWTDIGILAIAGSAPLGALARQFDFAAATPVLDAE